MRPFPAIAALFVCASVAAAGAPLWGSSLAARNVIELPMPVWSAGDVARSVQTSHSTLHTIVVIDGKLVQEFDCFEDKHAEKSIHILAADDRGPTKVRIKYGALSAVKRRPLNAGDAAAAPLDDEFDTRNPLQNRTFHLLRKRETFTVLDGEEKRVEPGLARLVLEEEGISGTEYLRAGDIVARELAGRTLEIGVELTLSPAAARALIVDADSPNALQLLLTPKAVRTVDGAHRALFSARLTTSNPSGVAVPRTTVDLRGDFTFDADSGRCVAIELLGQVNLAYAARDDSRAVEMTGQGPWVIRESVSYEQTR
ncbi:MAG: hypothetical protein JNL28_08755 [Planctomycetes bacterium]|nr:hypothetical protein [Planctomycetota bacterium]